MPKTFIKTTETVDSVIHCAAEHFHKYGYRKTTVDDIASMVHISKKTLYALFPSKEEILREVAWRDTIEIVRTFSNSLSPDTQPDTLIMSLCRYIFFDRIKKGKKGLFKGIHSDDRFIKNAYLEALKRVVKEIYKGGCDTGLFKPFDPVFATEVIVGMLATALDHFHKTTEPVAMFNDTLTAIADAVAYKNRIQFDAMG